MVEKELQAPEGGLPAIISKRYEMRGAQEPVAINGMEDLKITRREHYGTNRRALEARPANWLM